MRTHPKTDLGSGLTAPEFVNGGLGLAPALVKVGLWAVSKDRGCALEPTDTSPRTRQQR